MGAVGDGGRRSSSSSSSWKPEKCTSIGATMSVTPTPATESSRCCCGSINIYVNNNVQGVTNSVLVGSKVVMRDPGARVVSSRRPPRGGFCRGKQRRQKQRNETATWATAAAAAAAAMVFIAIIVSVIRKIEPS